MIPLARVALLRLVRDRSNLFFIVLFPLLLVLLIGISFGGTSDGPMLLLASTADDDVTAALTTALEDQGLSVTAADESSARSEVAAERADAALVVPALPTDGTANVELVVAQPDSAAPLASRVDAALGAVTTDRSAARALTSLGLPETAPADASGVELRSTLVDEGQESELQELAGLGPFDLGASSQLLLFVFITSLTGAATVVQMRRWGIVDRVLAGPTDPMRLIAGLGLGQLAIGLVQALIIVVATALLFDVDWGNPVATGAVVLVFAVVAAAASLLLGALLHNEEQATGIAVPLALGLAALGGSMLPLELFPDTLRTVARFTPHAWGNLAFAEIVRRDGGLLDVLPELGALALFALLLGPLAVVVLRRRIARG